MRKLLLLILLLVLNQHYSYSQAEDANIEIGEKGKKKFFSGSAGVIHADEDGYYVAKIKSRGFILIAIPIAVKLKLYLDYYSKDMTLQSSTEIKDIEIPFLKAKNKNFEFFAHDADENLYLYYSQADREKTYLLRLTFDKESYTFSNAEEVLTLRNEGKKDKRGTFSLFISPNGKQKAIVSVLDLGRKKGTTHIYVENLDENLKSTGSKEDIIPFGYTSLGSFGFGRSALANLMNSEKTNIALSNTGTLNLMAKVPAKFKWFGSTTYDYHILSLSDNSNEIESKKLNVKGKRIIDASILAAKDKVFCSGFYCNEDKSDIDGVFILELGNDNLKLSNLNAQNFSKRDRGEFLVSDNGNIKNRSDKKIKKKLNKKNKDVKIYNHDILDYVFFEDGSSTLISEQSYSYTTTSTTTNANGGVSYSTTTHYVHGDMVFLHFDHNGRLGWIKNLNKYQHYSGQDVSPSLFIKKRGDHINIVFYEPGTKKLRVNSIDKEGNYELKNLAKYGRKTELGKFRFIPHSTKDISEDEIIAFASRRRKTKMIKIKF